MSSNIQDSLVKKSPAVTAIALLLGRVIHSGASAAMRFGLLTKAEQFSRAWCEFCYTVADQFPSVDRK
jgi:hypothetical protein